MRASFDVQPLGGIAFTRIRQALTERHGNAWNGVTVRAINPADINVITGRIGLVGGMEITVPAQKRAQFTTGMRSHWMRRQARERDVPDVAPFIWQFTAGVRWTAARRAGS